MLFKKSLSISWLLVTDSLFLLHVIFNKVSTKAMAFILHAASFNGIHLNKYKQLCIWVITSYSKDLCLSYHLGHFQSYLERQKQGLTDSGRGNDRASSSSLEHKTWIQVWPLVLQGHTCPTFLFLRLLPRVIPRVIAWKWTEHHDLYLNNFLFQSKLRGFPGGSVVKTLCASAGDVVLIPDPGRSHMPQVPQLLSLCSRAWEPQLLTSTCPRVCALQQEKPSQLEAHALRLENSPPVTTTREKPKQKGRSRTPRNIKK